MLKNLISAFVAISLASCGCQKAVHTPLKISELNNSVGKIEIDSMTSIGTCSGFIVGPEVVMTAKHCIHEGAGYFFDGILGEELAVDADDDLALLLFPGLNGPSVDVADVDPAIGDEVSTIGFPRGIYLVNHGVWSGRTPDISEVRGSIAMVEYFGASGSPVFNKDGLVIGVLVSIGGDFTGVTFVVVQDHIRKFLDDNHFLIHQHIRGGFGF